MIKRKKILLTGILFVLTLMIYANFTIGIVRCTLYKSIELDKISEYIYVDKSMPAEQRQSLLAIYYKSQKRIEAFFGTRRAKPYLIVGNTDFVIKNYGNQNAQTGLTHLSFLASYIVLDSMGLNIDVISHELCHAELKKRVGWYAREFKIPTWFDEGLAMLVDKRFPEWEVDWEMMTDKGKTAPSLETLANAKQFFEGKNTYIHYITAQKEVDKWYKKSEQEGLLEFINSVNEGASFEKAFSQ